MKSISEWICKFFVNKSVCEVIIPLPKSNVKSNWVKNSCKSILKTIRWIFNSSLEKNIWRTHLTNLSKIHSERTCNLNTFINSCWRDLYSTKHSCCVDISSLFAWEVKVWVSCRRIDKAYSPIDVVSQKESCSSWLNSMVWTESLWTNVHSYLIHKRTSILSVQNQLFSI